MPRTLLLFFCLVVGFLAQAQAPFSRQFWLDERQTPIKVNALVQAVDQYIWLATDMGVYRFNGRSFTLIKDSVSRAATAIAAHNGLVYVGYEDGSVATVQRDQLAALEISFNKPSSAITAIRPQNGVLYITTEEEGVFAVLEKNALSLSTSAGLSDNFVYDAVVSDDQLLLATDLGMNVVRWHGAKPELQIFTTANGLPDNIVRVIKPVRGSSIVWVGTQEGGVVRYHTKQQKLLPHHSAHRWEWGQVNDLLPMSETVAWGVTEEGFLLHLQLGGDTLYVKPYQQQDLRCYRLIKDGVGNIWCATNKGLLLSTALYLRAQLLSENYKLSRVAALVCDRQDNLWFSQDNTLFKLPLSGAERLQVVTQTPEPITCLNVDGDGNLWVGTFGSGLYYFDHQQLYPQHNIAALARGHILSVATTARHVWVASLNGVEQAAFIPEKKVLRLVKHHNKMSGIGSDYVYQLYPDRQQRIWMATDGGGVTMYDGMSYTCWDETSGLKSKVVYTLTEDADGNMCAGTFQQGVFRLRQNVWQQFDEADGLLHPNVYTLKGMPKGQVVVVDESGVSQWYPAGNEFRHTYRSLGLDADSALSVPNCIAADKQGNVYVPFAKGFMFFLANYPAASVAPSVSIRSISLFNEVLTHSPTRFHYHEHHLSFRFDAINFSDAEKLQYRYRLDNYDTSWVYTTDEIVSFAQLPPGDFTFHVQAAIYGNFSRAAEAVYSFTIVPPYWQRTWFLLLVAAVLVALGYVYVKLRERNLQKLSRLQRERMVFEYEHLKSQVNPHFLFNSLNTLVSLIEDNQKAAVDYTVQLSDLYRNMLSFKDQDLIPLAEEVDIIRNYMYIQQSRFGAALRLDISIPDELLSSRRIVPLALQLLVENAIKHNVVSLAKPLTISIAANHDTVTVSNPIQPKASKEKGAGLGIENIRKRYRLLTTRAAHFGAEGGMYVVKLPLL